MTIVANSGFVATLGIDLAKNVFALHGVNSEGKVQLLRTRMVGGVGAGS